MSRHQQIHREQSKNPGTRRGWIAAGLWAAIAMGAFLVFAVGLNAVIGRRIHWDIVTAVGVGGWLFLTVARRRGLV